MAERKAVTYDIYEIRAENTMLGGVGDVAVTTPRHSAALLRGSLLFVVLTVTFSRVIKTQRLQSQMIRPPLIKSRHFPPAKKRSARVLPHLLLLIRS